jgi:AraC-like DNA-binding protein
MNQDIIKEVSTLTENDCFAIFPRLKNSLDVPLHFHSNFELNFIFNGGGGKRIVGNHEGQVEDMELVLIGPNLYHAWQTDKCPNENIREVVIQFHKDLFDRKFLYRNQLVHIKNMFENSQRGILFSRETAHRLADRIINLSRYSGFESAMELFSLLYDLSISKNNVMMSDPGYLCEDGSNQSEKVERIFDYLNNNYYRDLSLKDISKVFGMSGSSFARIIKKWTGMTFVNVLNEVRIAHATKMLINSTSTISEIAYQCGFNNLSYFNKIFKEKRSVGPKQYRKNYTSV